MAGQHESWLAAADSLAANLAVLGTPHGPRWYRFGDAFLALRSNDPAFLARFSVLFGSCGVAGPRAGLPAIQGRVVLGTSETGAAMVSVEGSAVADPAGLAAALFAEDGVLRTGSAGGWTGFAFRESVGAHLAVRGGEVVVSADGPWPYIAGAVLVHQALAAQPDLLFVHAAGVRLGGSGVLFVGPRGSGKTTLAIGLAARGHACLSDEVGAIRLNVPAIVPFPRAAGVRPGPRASAAAAALDRPELPVERFADGSTKTLVPLHSVGPEVPLGDSVPLEHIVALDGRATQPCLTALDPTPRNAQFLAPVKSMPFSHGSASKTMRLIALASTVTWHRLTAGSPDETLTLLEETFANR